MEHLSRALMLTGVALLVVGLVLHFSPSIPVLGKLPGDIRIDRGAYRLYFPLGTSVLLSVVLSLAYWVFSKLR